MAIPKIDEHTQHLIDRNALDYINAVLTFNPDLKTHATIIEKAHSTGATKIMIDKDADITLLKSQNERLKVALSFYADKNNWVTNPHDNEPAFNGEIVCEDWEDSNRHGGKLARQVLKDVGE